MKFVNSSGLKKKSIFILFTIKVLAGICYGLVSTYFFNQSSDYSNFEVLSKIETNTLLHNPEMFLNDIFSTHYNTINKIFIAEYSYWNDLPLNIIIKTLGLLNLINLGSFFISNLFLNFISFL